MKNRKHNSKHKHSSTNITNIF